MEVNQNIIVHEQQYTINLVDQLLLSLWFLASSIKAW